VRNLTYFLAGVVLGWLLDGFFELADAMTREEYLPEWMGEAERTRGRIF
jgi:hypothetical protein